MSPYRPFAGHLALVTGSTSGIGLGIAEVLAAAGANIVHRRADRPRYRRSPLGARRPGTR